MQKNTFHSEKIDLIDIMTLKAKLKEAGFLDDQTKDLTPEIILKALWFFVRDIHIGSMILNRKDISLYIPPLERTCAIHEKTIKFDTIKFNKEFTDSDGNITCAFYDTLLRFAHCFATSMTGYVKDNIDLTNINQDGRQVSMANTCWIVTGKVFAVPLK